jgi:hypothetical protein
MPMMNELYGRSDMLARELNKQGFTNCGNRTVPLSAVVTTLTPETGRILLSSDRVSYTNRRWWVNNFNKFMPILHSSTCELLHRDVISRTLNTTQMSVWSRLDKVALLFIKENNNSMYKIFNISDIIRYSNPQPVPGPGISRPYPWLPSFVQHLLPLSK